MTDANDQAFPVPTSIDADMNSLSLHEINGEGGLTKREYFAGISLAAIYGNEGTCQAIHEECQREEKVQNKEFDMGLAVAACAVRQADLLIQALNHQPGEDWGHPVKAALNRKSHDHPDEGIHIVPPPETP